MPEDFISEICCPFEKVCGLHFFSVSGASLQNLKQRAPAISSHFFRAGPTGSWGERRPWQEGQVSKRLLKSKCYLERSKKDLKEKFCVLGNFACGRIWILSLCQVRSLALAIPKSHSDFSSWGQERCQNSLALATATAFIHAGGCSPGVGKPEDWEEAGGWLHLG